MPAETIFALASGAGRCGVAVFRLSGPSVRGTLQKHLSKAERVLARPRELHCVDIYGPSTTAPQLDSGMAVFFPRPHSFTGEDVAELHVHGSPAVVRALTRTLASTDPSQLRAALPGEFARRAFANNKLDVVGAEALSDLLNAETEAQRVLAVCGAARLRHASAMWRSVVVDALAAVEAYIDFGDDDAVSHESVCTAAREVAALQSALRTRLHADRSRSRIVKSGLSVAIAGSPNAGKSTLFNALAGHNASIVSPHAGTTRDVLSAAIDAGGYCVNLSDTAGVRDVCGAHSVQDAIEEEGINRALDAISKADHVIVVIAPDSPLDNRVLLAIDPKHATVVLSKSDVSTDTPIPVELSNAVVLRFSDRSGTDECVGAISQRLSRVAKGAAESFDQPLTLYSERHEAHVAQAVYHLEQFLSTHTIDATIVAAAAHLRAASHVLGAISGDVIEPDEIHDRLFAKFCVGK